MENGVLKMKIERSVCKFEVQICAFKAWIFVLWRSIKTEFGVGFLLYGI